MKRIVLYPIGARWWHWIVYPPIFVGLGYLAVYVVVIVAWSG